MFVEVDLRDDLAIYCMIKRLTQEKAANQALREMLDRAKLDPALSTLMQTIKSLRNHQH